jgi:hypothetical protein
MACPKEVPFGEDESYWEMHYKERDEWSTDPPSLFRLA